jgi:hypothetical protein
MQKHTWLSLLIVILSITIIITSIAWYMWIDTFHQACRNAIDIEQLNIPYGDIQSYTLPTTISTARYEWYWAVVCAELIKYLSVQHTFPEKYGHILNLIYFEKRVIGMVVSVGNCNIVVFRGTSTYSEWNIISDVAQVDGIYAGFLHIYNAIKTSIVTEPTKHIIVTGHSLGAAIAILYALDNEAVAVYTFGGPRVGNVAFAKRVDDTINLWRIVNAHDFICDVPLSVTPNMRDTKNPLIFQHGGTAVYTTVGANLGTFSSNHTMSVYSNTHIPHITSLYNPRPEHILYCMDDNAHIVRKIGRRRKKKIFLNTDQTLQKNIERFSIN